MSLETISLWREWLSGQQHREDPVGDFAKRFLGDPSTKGLLTLSSIDRYYRDLGYVGDEWIADARDQAWREYSRGVVEAAFKEDGELWDL